MLYPVELSPRGVPQRTDVVGGAAGDDGRRRAAPRAGSAPVRWNPLNPPSAGHIIRGSSGGPDGRPRVPNAPSSSSPRPKTTPAAAPPGSGSAMRKLVLAFSGGLDTSF